MLAAFIAQVVTDPALNLTNLSQQDFEALEATWSNVNAALLRQKFKPERWLQGEHKPSGLLTFRWGCESIQAGVCVWGGSLPPLPGSLSRGERLKREIL